MMKGKCIALAYSALLMARGGAARIKSSANQLSAEICQRLCEIVDLVNDAMYSLGVVQKTLRAENGDGRSLTGK